MRKARKAIVSLATTALLAGSVAGVVSAGTAGARPGPMPLSWPGCPEDHPAGPCHWCPGDPQPQTGNLRVNPVIWDWNICHTYYFVYSGQGNVAQNIWDGENPPAPPPWPRGLNFCPIPPWCP
jgi:hypothetical protein